MHKLRAQGVATLVFDAEFGVLFLLKIYLPTIRYGLNGYVSTYVRTYFVIGEPMTLIERCS